MDIASLLALAGGHVQSGRYDEAERLYRQILAVRPEEPNALYGLGYLALLARAYDDAARLLRAAVKKMPRAGQWYLTLGDALRYAHRPSEAMAAYEKAAKLMPDHAMAHNQLGAACQESGESGRALIHFRRAVDLSPDDPQYLTNLGGVLQVRGEHEEAIVYFRRALRADPDYAPALLNLGASLVASGRFQEAIAPLEQARARMPDFQEVTDNLAIALANNEQREEAIALLQEHLSPRGTPLTYQELADCLRLEHRYREAEEVARAGIARFPDRARLRVALGEVLSAAGRVEEAIAVYREAQDQVQDTSLCAAGIAFLLNAVESPPAAQRAAAQAAAQGLAGKPFKRPTVRKGRGERLRIGYVSPDFRRHSVAYFFDALLRHHDRQRVEVFLYHANTARDDMTERFAALADAWREIGTLSDEQAGGRIIKDGIDILVDLAGHTAGNRLGIFARRAAPLQFTYLGYPNTTGLPTMDYRLTDGLADPEGLTDPYYSERLLRLPRVFLAYTAPEDAPPVAAPPLGQTGQLTFGSFNAIHKLSDPVLDLWAAVLAAVPGSRLLLKTGALTSPDVRAWLTERFQRRGISPSRLSLLGFAKTRESHLATYGQVDIALDTFPYHGTTTTCEALYMGVPVLTLAGATHASRVGVSLLSSLGLKEYIAEHPADFVARAVALARAPDQLAALRNGLRDRLAASPLMDGAGLAQAVEAAYRQAWDTPPTPHPVSPRPAHPAGSN